MIRKKVFKIKGKKLVRRVIKIFKRLKEYRINHSFLNGEFIDVSEIEDTIVFTVKIRKAFVTYKDKHDVYLNVFNRIKSKLEQEGNLYRIHDEYYLYRFQIKKGLLDFDKIKNYNFKMKIGTRQFRIRKKK